MLDFVAVIMLVCVLGRLKKIKNEVELMRNLLASIKYRTITNYKSLNNNFKVNFSVHVSWSVLELGHDVQRQDTSVPKSGHEKSRVPHVGQSCPRPNVAHGTLGPRGTCPVT